MAPAPSTTTPPARRHFVSSSRHLRTPPGRARGPSPAPLAPSRAHSHPPPLRTPHAAPPAAPGRAGSAGPAGAEPAARSCGGALARPSCGLLAACAAACAGRGRPGPGERRGPARGSYLAGGGRRRSLGAASLSATGPSAAAAAAAAAGRAGGREGREGPSSELSGSGQAPRAGPAVSTSRHCPREPRSRRKGARRRRRLGPPARPRGPGRPGGPGACVRGGRSGGRGDGAGAARRRSVPRLLLPPPPPRLGRAAPPGARRAPPGARRCPGTPAPPGPSMPGQSLPRSARPAARPGPAVRSGDSAAPPRDWTRGYAAGSGFLGCGLLGCRFLGCEGSALGRTRAEGRGLRGLGSPWRGARPPTGITGNKKDSGKQRGAVLDPQSPRRTGPLHAWRDGAVTHITAVPGQGGVAFCGP
ncbi:collagen alpha-1(I) chain-like [Pseudopipra pipra]|uniref:collagen alpha-1(I) chain-like n=1 Tax=Pseudopipra pipra TaxID=415032 RepID=UPI0031386966